MKLADHKTTREKALSEGYAPLTKIYTIDEYWMLTNAVCDLYRCGIKFLLVPVNINSLDGVEIWRLKEELKVNENEY